MIFITDATSNICTFEEEKFGSINTHNSIYMQLLINGWVILRTPNFSS